MSDLINRQQALDAIKYAELGCEYEAIEALPSAQPEPDGFTKWALSVADSYRTQTKPHCTPCDLCKYNPPSSVDGKPCTICPAVGRGESDGDN